MSFFKCHTLLKSAPVFSDDQYCQFLTVGLLCVFLLKVEVYSSLAHSPRKNLYLTVENYKGLSLYVYISSIY